jgi:hypothetical protein
MLKPKEKEILEKKNSSRRKVQRQQQRRQRKRRERDDEKKREAEGRRLKKVSAFFMMAIDARQVRLASRQTIDVSLAALFLLLLFSLALSAALAAKSLWWHSQESHSRAASLGKKFFLRSERAVRGAEKFHFFFEV